MKARGITQDVYNHLDWLITGQALVQDPALLSERVAAMLSQETEIRAHLEHKKPGFVSRAKGAGQRLAEILANKK
jgi:hypothetical protein